MEIKIKASLKDLDLDTEIPVPCPDCGHETPVPLGKLRPQYSFICGNCGETIINTKDVPKDFEALLRDQVDRFNKAF